MFPTRLSCIFDCSLNFVSWAFRFVLVLPLFLTACAAVNRMSPLPRTFLEDVDITQKRKNLPFEHAWLRPGGNKSKSRNVYFEPIRTDLLPSEAWTQSSSLVIASEADYQKEAKALA